jgi:hypothetical protein
MSKYEAYLKKLDLNIQSFELEYNNKIESTRYYYEDIIKKTNEQHNNKVASLINGYAKTIELLEGDEVTLKKNHQADKASLISGYDNKIKALENQKLALAQSHQLEKDKLIDKYFVTTHPSKSAMLNA